MNICFMLGAIMQHDIIYLVALALPAVTTGSSIRCPFGKPVIGSVEDSKVFQPHLTYVLPTPDAAPLQGAQTPRFGRC